MQRLLLIATSALLLVSVPLVGRAPNPAFRAELLFPVEHWHNHSASIVQHPAGHLFVTWFHGSGERTADDVEILGAWQKAGTKTWSAPMQLADTPGYPDTNPTLFVDRQSTLWLLWPTILANEWPTALMKVKTAARWPVGRVPTWDRSEVMHITPPDRFAEVTRREADRLAASLPADEARAGSPSAAVGARRRAYLEKVKTDAAEKLTRRLGWMTRVHPLQLEDGRLIVPLYSDGFSFSLMAISDDGGATWTTSDPLVGGGNIQPALARRRDGTIVAYMRDNGPPPKRVHVSESKDRGQTWSTVVDSDLPNPGTSVDVVVLRSGTWALVYNDLERGRHSLAVALSTDEGRTWPVKRHLERDPDTATTEDKQGQYHYPSIIQARDGMIHVAYSVFLPPASSTKDEQGRLVRKSIKHAAFDEAWVRAGDTP
ncbi:MAG TPA: exo-alpha-sialidase [Luteitalea sp.]|nr:exo-alpha-sialidase [Luteitalea sp.]